MSLGIIKSAVVLGSFVCGSLCAQVYQAQPGNQAIQSSVGVNTPIVGNADSLTANTQSLPEKQNPFLEYFPRQGVKLFIDSATFFFQDGQSLRKGKFSQASLKKSVFVFFGDWCPSCQTFLTGFAGMMDLLSMYGIEVIFVHVPVPSTLKNWKDPTLDDFNIAENKISSYGIKLSSGRAYVVWVGDGTVHATSGIEALPVVVAVKDGKEMFRVAGSNATSKMNLSNPDVLKDFLKIWSDEVQSDPKGLEQKQSEKTASETPVVITSGARTYGTVSKVDRVAASRATEALNSTPIKPRGTTAKPAVVKTSANSCWLTNRLNRV